MNRHFQAELADCGWMAVCRLQADRFLPIASEMLSSGGSVRLLLDTRYLSSQAAFTGRQHGYCVPNTREYECTRHL